MLGLLQRGIKASGRLGCEVSKADSIVPKNLREITPAAAENEKITAMRVAMKPLLNLQCQPLHARRMSVCPVATRCDFQME